MNGNFNFPLKSTSNVGNFEAKKKLILKKINLTTCFRKIKSGFSSCLKFFKKGKIRLQRYLIFYFSKKH